MIAAKPSTAAAIIFFFSLGLFGSKSCILLIAHAPVQFNALLLRVNYLWPVKVRGHLQPQAD